MNKLKFVSFTILGLFLFLVPFPIDGNTTIFISHFTKFVKENFSGFIYCFTLLFQFFVIITTIIGLVRKCIFKKRFNSDILNELFITSNLTAILKLIGSVFFILVTLNLGGNILNNADTGVTTHGLVMTLYITFFIGIILLPLITNFGAIEFVGLLLAKFMRKFFNVPGYATIDALASFVGDGTIGIVVTDKQYQKGYYTQREAAIIATSFSIVGISFATVVAEELGLSEIFALFYFTIFLVVIALAFITSRLPLKKFKDTYYDGKKANISSENGNFKDAVEAACLKANENKIHTSFKEALVSVLFTYINFIPIIMCVGTIGLIISTYTNLFSYITIPLIPILELLGFGSDSSVVAPSLFVGFIDMYLPSLLISTVESSAVKFFVGVISFSQLIFLSETGMILVASKIGFNFGDIIKIFLFRTIVSIPITWIIMQLLIMLGILSF